MILKSKYNRHERVLPCINKSIFIRYIRFVEKKGKKIIIDLYHILCENLSITTDLPILRTLYAKL